MKGNIKITEVGNLIVLNNALLDASGYTITVNGYCKIISARLICTTLNVLGDLTVQRKLGDTAYTNLLTVDALNVNGDVELHNTTWSTLTTTSTNYNYIGGNLSLYSSTCNYISYSVLGTLYDDTTTLTENNIQKSTINRTVGGDVSYPNLTTISFSTDVSSALNTVKMANTGGGTGGKSIAPVSINLTYMSEFNAPNLVSISCAAANGQASSAITNYDIWPVARGGAGGIINFNLNMIGNCIVGSCTITNTAGNGGASYDSPYSYSIGGAGGGATIPLDNFGVYGETEWIHNVYVEGSITGSFSNTITAGSGGSGGSGGDAYGDDNTQTTLTETDNSNVSIPLTPVLNTTDGATISTLEFSIPIDLNGDDLDFEIDIEFKVTEKYYDPIATYDSNNNASLFSETPPYTQGTGSVTIDLSSLGLDAGTYHWRARAIKDSDTSIKSLNSEWREFEVV